MDISVLTPSYEYGRFIADGIESVVQQEDLRLQHIIQDAGSGDESLEVVRSFGDRVEWASEIDLGQSDGLNEALATGDWIAQLNADEYYLPDGLRVLMEEGEKHSADVVYGDCVTEDREGRVIGLRPQHPFSRRILRLYGPFPEMVTQCRENAICDTQLVAGRTAAAASKVVQRPRSAMVQGAERCRHILSRSLLPHTNERRESSMLRGEMNAVRTRRCLVDGGHRA
jgi:glycosyltransferase involved in cell wall biosynthesis